MDNLKELKVIYIEDDHNTRSSIERFLKRRFGKVFLAENAEKGIELFNETDPDIAIVDLLLPGMSGLEMIRRIRQTNTRCKFLITSSLSDAATILEAVDLDIENYIVKPLNPEVFEEKLRRIGDAVIREKKITYSVKAFDLKKKSETEEVIRKSFIRILKEKSGKGPRDTVVFMSGRSIEIVSYGVLSVFDRTLMKNIKNTGHVEEGRRLLYMESAHDIKNMIHKTTGAFVELRSISTDAARDREKVIFTICEE